MIYEIPIVLPPDENDSDPPSWRHWTWWLRPIVALPLMLCVLLLLSPFLVRGWHLAKVPDIADPFDVDAFLSETVDDKDNAFMDYNAAMALLVPGRFSQEEFDAGWEKASPPLRAWVIANRLSLDRWRSGTEKVDAIDGDLRRSDRVDSLPEVTQSRELLRLACLQGEREQTDGHMAEAWQWYRASMRFSRHVAQRKGAIGRVVGVAFHTEAATRIARLASDPRTNAEALKLALGQLTEDFRLTRPFSESLKVEYCDIRRLDLWDGRRQFNLPPFQDGDSWRNSRVTLWCLGEPERTFRLHELVVENWLNAGDLPRSSLRRIAGAKGSLLDLKAQGSGVTGGELLRLLDTSENVSRSVTNLGETRNHIDRELARHESLRLMMACQLWFRRNGTFPANLNDLVPDVMTELPTDPFSPTGEVIRYRRDDEEAIVYSIGPDEVDDHGKVRVTPGKGYLDIGYRLMPPRVREQPGKRKPVNEP